MHEEKGCCQNHEKIVKVAVVLNDQRTIEAYHQASQFLLLTFDNGVLDRQDLIRPEGEEKKLCRRFMLSLGVHAIVTLSMSKHTYEKYKTCNISVFHSNQDLANTVTDYLAEKLKSIDDFLVDLDDTCQGHSHEHQTDECYHGKK